MVIGLCVIACVLLVMLLSSLCGVGGDIGRLPAQTGDAEDLAVASRRRAQ
jgi:hypothetical protein